MPPVWEFAVAGQDLKVQLRPDQTFNDLMQALHMFWLKNSPNREDIPFEHQNWEIRGGNDTEKEGKRMVLHRFDPAIDHLRPSPSGPPMLHSNDASETGLVH